MSIAGANDSRRAFVSRRTRRRPRARARACAPAAVRVGLADRHQPHRRRDCRREARVGERLDRRAARSTPRHTHAPANAIGSAGPMAPFFARRPARSRRGSGCSACHVVSSRSPMARLERLALDDGAQRGELFVQRDQRVPVAHPQTPATPATPPALPSVRSSRRGRRRATRADSSASRDAPAAVAASSPSEYANAPIGNSESQRCREGRVQAGSKALRLQASKVLPDSIGPRLPVQC